MPSYLSRRLQTTADQGSRTFSTERYFSAIEKSGLFTSGRGTRLESGGELCGLWAMCPDAKRALARDRQAIALDSVRGTR